MLESHLLLAIYTICNRTRCLKKAISSVLMKEIKFQVELATSKNSVFLVISIHTVPVT